MQEEAQSTGVRSTGHLANKLPCRYCGSTANKDSEEHVIPKSLGGTKYIRNVCEKCNNGTLSAWDDDLAAFSPFSVFAANYFGKPLEVWGVDRNNENLLVEANADWDGNQLSSLRSLPQIHFTGAGPQVRGDAEEMHAIGGREYTAILRQAIRMARGAGLLHYRLVPSQGVGEGYRLPPRVFSSLPIAEVIKRLRKRRRISLLLLADCKAGFRQAQSQIDRLFDYGFDDHASTVPFSQIAQGMFRWVPDRFASALIKIAINAIVFVRREYLRATELLPLIRAEAAQAVSRRAVGFVDAQAISIKPALRCHQLQLAHDSGTWKCLASWFGGTIGTFVEFRAPAAEDASTIYMNAPVGRNRWEISTSNLIVPLSADIVSDESMYRLFPWGRTSVSRRPWVASTA